MNVDRVWFTPFRTLILEGVLVEDQHGDTLAYIGKLEGLVARLNTDSRRLRLNELSLEKTEFNLQEIDTSGTTNLDFIVDYFSSEDTTAGDPWNLSVRNFYLENSSFTYRRMNIDSSGEGIDFDDLDLKGIDLNIAGFRNNADTLLGEIRHLGFREKSGFVLDTLQADIKLSGSELVAKGLRIVTPTSRISTDLHYQYDGYPSYREFISEVNMRYEFQPSRVDISDIAYFAPQLRDYGNEVILSGRFRGPVSNLKGRDVKLEFGNYSRFSGSFDLTGLPNVKGLFVNLSADVLQSHFDDLQQLSVPSANPNEEFQVPEILRPMGLMRFNGSFTGFLNEFVAYGTLNTSLGRVKTDLELQDLEGEKIKMLGRMEAIDFSAGRLLGEPAVGKISASLKVDAEGETDDLRGMAEGEITSLHIKGYEYRSIELDGRFASQRFNGYLSSRDENLVFDFDGLVDWEGERPILDFAASVYHADLQALNLVESPDSLTISTSLKLNATGKTLDEFTGTLTADNLIVCEGEKEFFFDRINLNSQQLTEDGKISLKSDFLNFDLVGKYDLQNLKNSVFLTLNSVFPSQFPGSYTIDSSEDFTFSAEVKRPKDLLALLGDDFSIAPNTILSGEYNSTTGRMDVFFRTDSLRYKELIALDLKLDAEKQEEIIVVKSSARQFNLSDSLEIENLGIDAKAYQDEVELRVDWQNESQRSRGSLALNAWARDRDSYSVELLPSALDFFGESWAITDTANVRIDSSAVKIQRFEMKTGNQRLAVRGSISENPADTMLLEADSVQLAILSKIPGFKEPDVSGVLNLQARIKDLYKLRQVNSDVEILDLAFGERGVGTAIFNSSWNGEEDAIVAEGHIENEKLRALDFEGSYFPGKEEESIDLVLSLNEFDLEVFNTIDLNVISNVSGKATGDVNVSGTPEDPVLDGEIDFDNMLFTVDYLNTEYRFNDVVRVEDGWIGIDYKPIYDQFGNQGNVVAQAYHTDFENWNFDIYAEVENFQLLNTSSATNELYYGDGFATGTVQIGGYPDNLEINVEVSTDEKTVIKLPLSESSEVELENFVHFVGKDDADSLEASPIDLTGIDMELDITATPDAEVQLIFDELVGDVLKARGNGNLKFEINPAGDFNMYGPFEIESGDYLFSLQGVVKKRFILEQGGTMRWYGDPYQADININAIYNMRAALFDIMVGEQNQQGYRNRVPVELVMKLSNQLTNPDIAFDIRLPASGETERAQLESVISTDLERNKQVFALLVMNRFLPPAGSGQGSTGLGASSVSATTSDLVSNTLSNWLSQLSQEVNVGIEYRPGDNISSEELAVALSTYLFNERLLVSGNFGVRDETVGSEVEGNQSELIGDFELQYMITEDGRIRLKVYNRSNTYDVTESNPDGFTQGVGLVYQEDFDTFGELFRKIGGLFGKREEEAN